VLTFGQVPAFSGGVDPVPLVRKGDPAMSAAFARAAATLDAFLAVWRRPPSGASGFAVKIGLADGKDATGFVVVRPDSEATTFVEWFWCGELQGDGERFTARVHDEPESLRNVRYGQVVRFTRADIGDWMYWRDGKIVGNVTACPALAHATAQERRQMKDRYGIVCD
jgi:uncharacterized protein YegJ (DUF2314 family)